MYIKLETNSELRNLLAYKIAGKITTSEYDEIRKELEKAIEEHGKIRVLIEIGHLRFPEVGAIWDDLKFSMHHIRDFERFAVVGDKGWEQWWVNIVGKMVPADAKYFDLSEQEQAWYWIQGDG